MIDLHCHILPGVDDGPETLEAAIEMARMAEGDGTKVMFATPHVHWAGLDRQGLEARVTDFRNAVADAGLALDIRPGGDVASTLGLAGLQQFQLGDGPYVLLEFPHSQLPAAAESLVFSSLLAGLIPILTHPERHPTFIRDPQRLERFIEQGMLVQVTAGSLLGEFGPDARYCAEHILRQDWVHFLASDGHGTRIRQPLLSAGLARAVEICGPAARDLVDRNPQSVCEGVPFL